MAQRTCLQCSLLKFSLSLIYHVSENSLTRIAWCWSQACYFIHFTTLGYFGEYYVLVHYAPLNALRIVGKLRRGSPFSGRHWVPIKVWPRSPLPYRQAFLGKLLCSAAWDVLLPAPLLSLSTLYCLWSRPWSPCYINHSWLPAPKVLHVESRLFRGSLPDPPSPKACTSQGQSPAWCGPLLLAAPSIGLIGQLALRVCTVSFSEEGLTQPLVSF